jgi:hypothetical protein
MRIMRHVPISILLLVWPLCGFAQQDLKCDFRRPGYLECQEREWKTYLGKYVCLLDHVGGIQYSDDAGRGRPFVGRIRPTEDKFFMEILEDSTLPCDAMLPSAQAGNCKTKYKMAVKSQNIFLREDGWSALLPQSFRTTGGGMTISAGGRFGGSYRFGWDSFVFDGRCEKIN